MDLIDFPFRKVSNSLASLVLVGSLSVMIARWAGYPPLLVDIADTTSMRFSTALGLFLSALAMYMAFSTEKPYRYLRIGLSLMILLIGAVNFSQYFFNASPNIDNLLIRDEFSSNLSGRMSLATACCFIAIGLGVTGLSLKHKTWLSMNQQLFHLVSLIALVSLISYLVLIPIDRQVSFFSTMAILTSLSLLLISFGLSLVNPTYGFNRLLLGRNAGSHILRQLFPFVVLFPLLLGYVLVLLSKQQLINPSSAMVILVISLIVLPLILISLVTHWLNQMDQHKIDLKQRLVNSNTNLLQYKHALDTGFIISIADASGKITQVNDNFCKVSGYTRDELVGKNHRIINSGYHSAKFFAHMWATMSRGKLWSGEIRNRAKDGSFYWVFTVIVPFTNEAGKVREYVSIRYNTTAQKETELELNELKSRYVQQLEIKNQELEQFAYIAAHDLQEPLRTVTNFSNVLHQKYADKLDSQGQKSLNFILNATQRMRMLVNGLLTYSRIGRMREREPINLEEQVRVVMDDMHVLIEERQAKIEIAPLPQIQANALEVRILLQNLINNAIKFQPEGQSALIKISAEEDELYWKIRIHDNGIGIAPEHHEKIFMIFQRLHSQGNYRGSGIGLAHCRKIAEQHGGRIWVDSEPGGGSTFYLTISKSPKSVLVN